jgi:hypothetical protein
MSRVCDFNLIKGLETRATATNSNSVNVVVNTPAPTPASSDSGTVLYPPPLLPQDANIEMPQLLPQQQQQESRDASNTPINELEFYKLLSSILSDVLKDNNPKLIINVIDTSGKIIIKAADLVRLIAIKTNHDVKDVNLRYIEEEPSCMSKVSPIKNISDIKINNESFSLRYNADYNILKDDFNISLVKVVI